jgi:uncharacterized RDD family membrane protein YckC
MATTMQPTGVFPATDPTAVFGRRVLAAVIDGVVVLVPGGAIASSQMEYITRDRVGAGFNDFCDDFMEQEGGTCLQLGDRAYFNEDEVSLGNLAFIGLAFLLFVIIQGLTGWTIGKLVTGLRTVKEDGSVVGIGKAFVRWLLWVVDGLPCLGLVGGITALTTKGHRRIGDMAAKTFVVQASAAGSPIVVPGLTAAPTGFTPTTNAGPGVPGGWGAPPPAGAPQAWGAPSTSAPPSAPSATGPQWDAARGTYIQWDPAQGRWLQWDEGTRTWVPIPGQ